MARRPRRRPAARRPLGTGEARAESMSGVSFGSPHWAENKNYEGAATTWLTVPPSWPRLGPQGAWAGGAQEGGAYEGAATTWLTVPVTLLSILTISAREGRPWGLGRLPRIVAAPSSILSSSAGGGSLSACSAGSAALRAAGSSGGSARSRSCSGGRFWGSCGSLIWGSTPAIWSLGSCTPAKALSSGGSISVRTCIIVSLAIFAISALDGNFMPTPLRAPTGLRSSWIGGSPSSLHCGRPVLLRNSASGIMDACSSGGRNAEMGGMSTFGMWPCSSRAPDAAPAHSASTASARRADCLMVACVAAAAAAAEMRAGLPADGVRRARRPCGGCNCVHAGGLGCQADRCRC
ncbi:MAG: hypothetical protein J3K34DRAFT_435115 [Monoraphidium minutum]|nr:MAG: hypothetical protein J3K34DRAFT_435115 [Monoraphidium minutum]